MLECENDNQRLESSFRQSTAVGSTWSAVRNAESGSNNIVWKTYMAFKELSLHVNEKVGSEGTAISNDLCTMHYVRMKRRIKRGWMEKL